MIARLFTRPSTVVTSRPALYWLLAGSLVAIGPHTGELPFWATAIFLTGIGWRLAATFRAFHLPNRWLRLAAALGAIALTLNEYGTLIGRDPGVTLLVALAGLKLLELQTRRDYLLAGLLLYVLLLTAFLYQHSLTLGLYGVLAVAVNTAALLQLGRHSALAWRANLRWTARLLAQAMPIMLVLYFLFPRIAGGLWGIPQAEATGVTGMPEVMRPGSLQRLSESTEPAFRVSFDGAPPAAALYWRGRIFWDSDGATWSSGAPVVDADADAFVPLAASVKYQVILEPQGTRWLYALDLPATAPPDSRWRAGYVLEHGRPLHDRYHYDLISYPRYRTGGLGHQERVRALALPAAASARVRELAGRWRASAAGDAAVVQAALAHFRTESFVYTLTPPALRGDPVDQFLFETRRGYCEHYAAAFVTLMRAAGVPSRVVVGYQGGEYNPAGNYFIVRQADAHAWAEVWLAGEGWRRVDPTAAVAPERIELGADAVRRLQAQGLATGSLAGEALRRVMALGWFDRARLQTRLMWDYANLSWYRWVADYGPERQAEFLARLGLSGYAVWAIGLALLALVGAYSVIRFDRRPPLDPAAALYRRFCRRCAAIGLPRAPAEGPLAFAQRVAQRRPDLASPVAAITQRYIDARYGEATAALVSLRGLVRAFRPRRGSM